VFPPLARPLVLSLAVAVLVSVSLLPLSLSVPNPDPEFEFVFKFEQETEDRQRSNRRRRPAPVSTLLLPCAKNKGHVGGRPDAVVVAMGSGCGGSEWLVGWLGWSGPVAAMLGSGGFFVRGFGGLVVSCGEACFGMGEGREDKGGGR